MKNVPIFKKKVKELAKELGLTPVEILTALDPICEENRKKSREQVEKDVAKWKSKNGIPRVKTDY